MSTPREALLEHALRKLVAAVADARRSRDGPWGPHDRVRAAAAGARTLLSPPHPDPMEGADAGWFTVEAGDYWGRQPLRCPACGGRVTFWARLGVMLGPDSHPLVILPIVHEPATSVECSRCFATAPYNDFLPPWSDFPSRRCACDRLFCDCPLPLTDADRVEEAEFMVEQFTSGLKATD